MPEYSERFFRSGTLRIHFRDWGNAAAPPLIIVHGLRDHSHSFDDLARGLLDRFRVFALDLLEPNDLARRLACFRDARLVEIAGAGHMVHFDRPRELVTTVRGFLLEGRD
jgi:pimeloyl-ACP methyl ester carboxylesterase